VKLAALFALCLSVLAVGADARGGFIYPPSTGNSPRVGPYGAGSSPPPPTPPTRVQIWSPSVYGAHSISQAAPVAFTAGNAVEVFAFSSQQGMSAYTVTATGLTFAACGALVSYDNTGGQGAAQMFVAANVPGTNPSVTVANDGSLDPTGQGVQFVASEYKGLRSSSSPCVQAASGTNVFTGATAALSGTVSGNLLSFGTSDSFGSITTTSSTGGAMNDGMGGNFGATIRGGDWQISPGGNVTGTHNGANGYNILIGVEYAARP